MYTAGVDVGLEYIKIVIIKDGEIVAKGISPSGGGKRMQAIEDLWLKTLESANISQDDVVKIISTGSGKYDVLFASGNVVEEIADAAAARKVMPNALAVVDIGADQVRVVTLGEDNKILETVRNQKCSAGLGLFLEYMGDRLEYSVEDMSKFDLSDTPDCEDWVNDGCPVFAELDALELLVKGVSRENVIKSIMHAAVVRINAILHDKIVPEKDATVLIGGVSKNSAIVKALTERSGINLFVPNLEEFGGAFGAALIAAE